MNFDKHRADMLAHYSGLVINPHWRQYVQHQTKLMAKECPALYHDFPEAMDAVLAAHRKAGASSSAATTATNTASV